MSSLGYISFNETIEWYRNKVNIIGYRVYIRSEKGNFKWIKMRSFDGIEIWNIGIVGLGKQKKILSLDAFGDFFFSFILKTYFDIVKIFLKLFFDTTEIGLQLQLQHYKKGKILLYYIKYQLGTNNYKNIEKDLRNVY